MSTKMMNRGTFQLVALGTAAFVALITTPPARAQSDGEYFNGVAIGAQAGWEDRRIEETVLPATLNTTLSDRRAGFAYGGYAGYDHQFENFVLGVEAGFSPNGKTLRADIPGGTIELDSKWNADFSVRAGIAVQPRVLVYGRVGYALNRYRISGFATGNTTPVASEGETVDGVLFGGGVEVAVSRNASVRAEYRHRKLDGSLSSNQALGGLTLRF
ncbi:outer membrane protein [Stakelama tenebrarum]|uniref:Porin family protein n=1 Tax=Stakelama tenebrarum TaxID=2711215 RepID=A0A6G6Y1T1_9SPHN|nr:outer membrane beta-barrel protein [Sphingosinithalassobacter tenebrarum]QIG78678.1 porin family protein [Sphingosinithalassobacter tenebrarum]